MVLPWARSRWFRRVVMGLSTVFVAVVLVTSLMAEGSALKAHALNVASVHCRDGNSSTTLGSGRSGRECRTTLTVWHNTAKWKPGAGARLFAVVAANGALSRGTNGISVTRVSTGVYRVDAGQDIMGCAYLATNGDTGTTAALPGYTRTAQTAGVPNVVCVYTYGLQTQAAAASPQDLSFHLAVFCP